MLRITLLCLFVAVTVSVVYGYYLQDQDFDDLEPGNEGYGLDYNYPMRKRGIDWCAKWGDYCVPKAKLKFAQCCNGLRCICGKFWTQGTCQCKSANILGR